MSRASRTEWAKRVERWKDSGLSAKQYAAEIGVKATTLSYWSWKLGSDGGAVRDEAQEKSTSRPARVGRGSVSSEAPARFVEVGTSPSVATPSALELVLRSGVILRVTTGFDEATLTRVVRAVEAAR